MLYQLSYNGIKAEALIIGIDAKTQGKSLKLGFFPSFTLPLVKTRRIE
jgi:hypothetical protein